MTRKYGRIFNVYRYCPGALLLRYSSVFRRASTGAGWAFVSPAPRAELASLAGQGAVAVRSQSISGYRREGKNRYDGNLRVSPLIVINDENLFVLNLALRSLTGPYGNEYGLVLAGASLATVPVIVLFAILQREFIEGLMAGAIKM